MPDLNAVLPPLVSVITVTYNSSLYVRDAVESVLAQTYTNIEYIIGDDCSTDNTWQVICGYSDPRIKAYRNETNLREYPNRNKAIDMATGKYLIFIDGDDIIFPHGIAFFVSQLEAFPEAALAVQKNYNNNLLFPALFRPKEAIANAVFGNNLLSSSFTSDFFRTDVLKKEGKLRTQYKTGDEEIRFRLAASYPVLYVAGWVSWPRETPGQASANLHNGIGLIEFCSYFETIMHAKPEAFADIVFETDLRARIATLKSGLIKQFLKKGQWGMAIRHMKQLGIGWKDLAVRSSVSDSSKDILTGCKPERPLKKGFLERGV